MQLFAYHFTLFVLQSRQDNSTLKVELEKSKGSAEVSFI